MDQIDHGSALTESRLSTVYFLASVVACVDERLNEQGEEPQDGESGGARKGRGSSSPIDAFIFPRESLHGYSWSPDTGEERKETRLSLVDITRTGPDLGTRPRRGVKGRARWSMDYSKQPWSVSRSAFPCSQFH